MIGSFGGTTLQTRYIFGIRGDMSSQLHYIDDHKIIYPAGHNIVEFNMEDKSQKFHPGSGDDSMGITCIALSPEKNYLAIGERSEKGPMLSIWDIKLQRRKKNLIAQEVMSKEFISIAFSSSDEKRFLITLTGAPDYLLWYWRWDQRKCLDNQKISTSSIPTQCSFSSEDGGTVVVTGKDIFKFFKIEEENRSLNAIHTQVNEVEEWVSTNYLCHAWTKEGYLLIGTDKGEILQLDQNGEYQGVLDSTHSSWPICSISVCSKGFIAGGAEGRLAVFILTDEKDMKSQEYEFISQHELKQLPGKPKWGNIQSMAIAPTGEDEVVIVTSDNQLLKSQINFEGTGELNFSEIICNFHSKGITGLDVCVRKPLLVTCSADGTIRLWNYAERKLVIDVSTGSNHEEPMACAFHPSGCHIIVGYADKVKLMNVFSTKLKTFHEIPLKGFKELAFAHGGQMFAAVTGMNINIYNFYVPENHQSFKSNKLRSVTWEDDDSGMITSTQEGPIEEWKLNAKDSTPVNSTVIRGKVTVTDAVKIADENKIYAVGNDRLIHEIFCKGTATTGAKIETGSIVGQITVTKNKELMIAGMAEPDHPGAIREYHYPPATTEYSEIQAHGREVVKVKLSNDNRHLFSVGKDGCLIIFEIKSKEKMRKEKEEIFLPISEEILTNKQEIDELHSLIEQNKTKIKQMNSTNDMDFNHEMDEQKGTIKKLQSDLTTSKTTNKARYDTLNEEINKEQNKGEQEIKNLIENFENELEEVKGKSSQDLLNEATKFNQLQSDREEQYKNYAEELKQQMEEYDNVLRRKKQDYEMELQRETERAGGVKGENEIMVKRHEEIMRQIEEDTNDEVQQINDKNTKLIEVVMDIGYSDKGELQVNQKKVEECKNRIGELQREMREKDEGLKNQKKENQKLLEQKDKLSKEIMDNDATIGNIERNIYDFKKRTQELEKFKFVLDYKIKELKRDINPREEEIQKLKKTSNNLDRRLKQFNRVNAHLGLIVKQLQDRQNKMQMGISEERNKLCKNAIIKKEMRDKIYKVVQYIDDYKLLRSAVEKDGELYQYYVEDTRISEADEDIDKEYEHQRAYLANSVKQLKKRLANDSQIHRQDNMRVRSENRRLIEEISQLRMRRKELEIEVRNTNQKHKESMSRMSRENEEYTSRKDTERMGDESYDEKTREIENNKAEIEAMKIRINQIELENRNIIEVKGLAQHTLTAGADEQLFD